MDYFLNTDKVQVYNKKYEDNVLHVTETKYDTCTLPVATHLSIRAKEYKLKTTAASIVRKIVDRIPRRASRIRSCPFIV